MILFKAWRIGYPQLSSSWVSGKHTIFTEDWWSYPSYPRSWETVLRENSRCMIYEDVFWAICYIYTFFPFKVNLIIPLFLFISLQCYIELSLDFLIPSFSLQDKKSCSLPLESSVFVCKSHFTVGVLKFVSSFITPV